MAEVIEIRAPLPAESAHLDIRHGTRPGVFVVKQVQPASVVEYVTTETAASYAHASPVVERRQRSSQLRQCRSRD